MIAASARLGIGVAASLRPTPTSHVGFAAIKPRVSFEGRFGFRRQEMSLSIAELP